MNATELLSKMASKSESNYWRNGERKAKVGIDTPLGRLVAVTDHSRGGNSGKGSHTFFVLDGKQMGRKKIIELLEK